MRHRKKLVKLGRTTAHRDALLANQVCSMIQHHRIKTTLAKAKAVRPFAEKMLTLGKRGDIFARRQAISHLTQKDAVKKLFEVLAPRAANRKGGYTRIIKLGQRPSDSALMAYIEWVDMPVTEEDSELEQENSSSEKEKAEAPPSKKTPKKSKSKKSKSPKKSRAKKAKTRRTHVRSSKARSSQTRRRRKVSKKSTKPKKSTGE